MTNAVMDITPWLKNGENTIELLYSSSLANAGGGHGPAATGTATATACRHTALRRRLFTPTA